MDGHAVSGIKAKTVACREIEGYKALYYLIKLVSSPARLNDGVMRSEWENPEPQRYDTQFWQKSPQSAVTIFI